MTQYKDKYTPVNDYFPGKQGLTVKKVQTVELMQQ